MTSDGRVKPLVSVLTPSIPSRRELLEECKASVRYQTEQRWEHKVWIDDQGHGCGWTMNHCAMDARGEWLLPLADDDLLLPGALRSLLAVSEEADIVWARPLVWGNPSPHLTQGQPPFIPSFALIRTRLWRELGGYDETRRREEDRDLWVRALNAGARFVLCEEGPTWIYRFSFLPDGTPRNKSYTGGVAA